METLAVLADMIRADYTLIGTSILADRMDLLSEISDLTTLDRPRPTSTRPRLREIFLVT